MCLFCLFFTGRLSHFLESETIWILFLHLKSVKLPSRAIVLTICDMLSKIKKLINNKCACVSFYQMHTVEMDSLGRREGERGQGGLAEDCRKILEKEVGSSNKCSACSLKCILEKSLCG